MKIQGKEILIQEHEVTTQREAVMYHLKNWESITSLTAINEYGATRLSSIIHNLRKEGYSITSIPMTRVNRFGHSVTIAKYKYLKPQTHGNN